MIASPPRKKICTRSTILNCCNFGADRHTKYPSAFFCNNCDWWDQKDIMDRKIQVWKQKCDLLNKKVTEQRIEIKAQKHQVRDIEEQLQHMQEINDNNKPASLHDGIATTLKLTNTFCSKYGSERLGREIADAVWSLECLKGVACDHLVRQVKKCL